MSQSQLPEDDYFSQPQPEPDPLPPAERGKVPFGSGPFAAAELASEDAPPPPDSAARRRRQRRKLEAGGSEYLAALILLGTPGFDFFLFSLLAGLVLAGAILTGAPALYLLAVLIAPFMAPVVGMTVGIGAGSIGLFFRSLASLLIGGLLVFAGGALAGIVVGQSDLAGQALALAGMAAQVSWPNLVVLVAGALVTLFLVGRVPNARPLVSSVALSYGLYVPVGAAGFGLGGGFPALWQAGLPGAATALALAVVIGTVMLVLAGLHPQRVSSWVAGVVLFILSGAAALSLLSLGIGGPTLVLAPAATASATAAPTLTTAPTPAPENTLRPSVVPSETPQPSRTATSTVIPTLTATRTLVPSATPVWGLVSAGEVFKGAIIRSEPGSNDQVTSLLNGAVLQILPEVVNKSGIIWLHVRAPDGKEGWVQASLIVTATPAPK